MEALYNYGWLLPQLKQLEREGFAVSVSRSLRCIVFKNVSLLGDQWSWKGETIKSLSVRINLPVDFPMTCPGVGISHPTEAIHIPGGIRWNGQQLNHVYSCGHDPWSWICFEKLEWDPMEYDLHTLLGIIEASIYKRRRVGG